MSPPTDLRELECALQRYRAFSALSADFVWEVDADLKYVYHAGLGLPNMRTTGMDMVGLDRIETVIAGLPPSEARDEHIRLLLAHEPIDQIIPTRRGDDGTKYSRVIAKPRFDDTGAFSGYHGCGHDVTEWYEMQQRLFHQAVHDDLTGLVNRREFHRRLSELLATCSDANETHVLCLIDLDRFKLVNDTAGHLAGDRLLVELARLMEEFIYPGETFARLGGDEFGLLLRASEQEAEAMAEQLIEAVSSHQFLWEERRFTVGASIGITPISGTPDLINDLFDRADSACYAAKANGRNQYVVYREDSEEWLAHREDLSHVEAIRAALRANRLRLFMQAIEPAGSAHEDGETEDGALADAESTRRYEILLRLESETGELLEPSTFIPIAEQFHFMQELDHWVLEHCLMHLESFAANGVDLSFSINLSGNTLSDRSALERILRTVGDSPTLAPRLCFEITETAAIGNLDNVVNFMTTLQKAGVCFALDDFGVGLSSFAYIRSLPIDYLKIDGYFIRNIRADETNRAITAAFITLSRDLGIQTVAESVEDKATRRAVAGLGIDYVQGFGIERPLDLKLALASAVAASMRRGANRESA